MIRRNTIVAAGVALLVAVPGFAESLQFDSDVLTVRNVIGEVRIEGARGSSFEVEVAVMGRDAGDGSIRIDAGERELDLIFPAGVREYVYPRLGRDSVSLGGDKGGRMADLLGADRVKVRGGGSGTELWADVTVRMPAGARLEIEHGVGLVVAEHVRGNLELATRSGAVQLDDVEGEIRVATGSGDVEVRRVAGEEVTIATGSGDVRGSGFDGRKLRVATGSGDVVFGDARADDVHFATGSGDVEARNLSVEDLNVGTGSGDVELTLDDLADGEVSVGTGSGDIALTLPVGVSAEVHAETDGGRIAVELGAGVEYRVREKDEVELTVGGGAARVRLGSGNGNIRVAS